MSRKSLSDLLSDAESTERTNEAASPKHEATFPAIEVSKRTDDSILGTQRFREINPERCRPWKYRNRDQSWLTPENCAELIESIRNQGQLDLGLVRPLENDPDHDYEVIYGVRRWYSCLQLPRTNFKARVTESDDKECAVLMHVENEESKDISAMEKARSYRGMVDKGLYGTPTELARDFNLSPQYVNRLCKAAELFDIPMAGALLEAHIRELPYRKAKELVEMCENEKTRERIEQAAIDLGASEGASLAQTLSTLVAAGKAKAKRKASESVSLFRKDKKRYAYVTEKPNGTVTITIEPGLLEAAGEGVDDAYRRIMDKVQKAIGISAEGAQELSGDVGVGEEG